MKFRVDVQRRQRDIMRRCQACASKGSAMQGLFGGATFCLVLFCFSRKMLGVGHGVLGQSCDKNPLSFFCVEFTQRVG